MKKIIALCLCAVMLLPACVGTAQAAGTPEIICEDVTCAPGEQITVSVVISNNPGFAYLEMTPSYSAELTLMEVSNGELTSEFIKGKQYVWTADEDVTADGVLMTFTFQVAETVAAGEYSVGFVVRTCGNYNEETVSFALKNGTVTVKQDTTAMVTFKDESGNVISQAEYAEGAELVAPTVDEIANGRFTSYIFEGWGEDYTGICQGDAEYTAIGTGYTDVQEALDQETAETVTLVEDVECRYLTVPTGFLLDMNGHTLTADYFTTFGDVVDGTMGGNGLLKINQGIHLASENDFLPIYDTASEGYRLYKYELQNLGFKTVTGDSNTLKAGFRLSLANTAGYSVLSATTDIAVDTVSLISWTGSMGVTHYTFKDDTLRNYAALVAADIAAKGSSSKAITLTLTGVDSLAADAVVSFQPTVATAPGVNAEASEVTWTAE